MDETLKQYLVKIGWNLDLMGYNNLLNMLSELYGKFTNTGNYMADSFAKSSMLIVGTIAGLTKAAWELAESVANADLKTEVLARKLWTTEENARSLASALDALDMSYEDLFFTTEEQFNRFLQLNSLGKTLEAPEELDETLRKIRDIQFEFSKMKMIAQYGTRWVVYFLGQYLGVDIDTVHEKLQSLNEWFIENMPKIADKIAYALSIAIRFFKALLELVKTLYDIGAEAFDRMGSSGVKAIAAIAGAFAVLKSGPVGWFLAALSLIVLLLDDFFTWKRGGISYFDWSGFADVFDKMGDKLGNAAEKFGDLSEKFGELMDKIGAKEKVMQLLEWFLDMVESGIDGINVVFDVLIGLLDLLQGNWDALKENGLFGDLKEFMDGISDNPLVKWIQGFGKGPTGVTGNFGGFDARSFFASALERYAGSGDSDAARTTLGVGNTSTQNNNTTINQTNNIQTSETGTAVEKAMKDSITKFRKWTPYTT